MVRSVPSQGQEASAPVIRSVPRSDLPAMDATTSATERTILPVICNAMANFYTGVPGMLNRIWSPSIDTDLMIRQKAGHYNQYHAAYHNMSASAPAYGPGNWLLLWTALVIAPSLSVPFNGKQAAAGGSFVEGVLVEWMLNPKGSESYETEQARLEKDPSKAKLFQLPSSFMTAEIFNVFEG